MKSNLVMPTIGIAGVTIPGAVDCINKINQFARESFGEFRRPNIKLDQPDFHPVHEAQVESRWDVVADRLVDSTRSLAESGADFAIIPANTVHIVIDEVQKRSSIPVLNMLDIVSDTCRKNDRKTVGVLGTRWTMAGHLYQKPFEKVGITEMIPSDDEQHVIQKAIFSELIPHGLARDETVTDLIRIVHRMQDRGCDAVILACTELPLVLNTDNCGIPAFDTTAILAQAAVTESVRLMTASELIAFHTITSKTGKLT